MKYRKFNKYEKKQIQSEQMANAMHGEGLYLYENNTDATLTLPRPTSSGLRIVGARKQFQGDNYYMQMVRDRHLRLIKELQSPAQEKAAMEKTEDKLILDQPDTVGPKGKVEHVVEEEPVQKLNESDSEEQPEVLLNEGPVDDGFVIVD
jgi:hypothetical protein